MANLCDFSMCVKGEHDNIEKFYNAMIQNGTTWMGRGTDASISYEDDGNTAYINGYCKWSIVSALIDDAISMRTNEKRWYGLDTSYEYITLWEACEKWNLAMEVYSEESGCCFQEHFMYVDGNILEDCIDWYEYYLGDFNTKEEAENGFNISITDDEWETQDYISRGGYDSWDFSI